MNSYTCFLTKITQENKKEREKLDKDRKRETQMNRKRRTQTEKDRN